MGHIRPFDTYEQRQLDRLQRRLLSSIAPPPGKSRTERTVVCTWEGAGLVQFSPLSGCQAPAPRGDSVRGRISGFSDKARRRMLTLLSKVRRADLGQSLFLTLTYPGAWSGDPDEWKRHLATFFKRLRRVYPDVSAVWRLEPQKRGAPHFHLIVFGVDFIPHGWVARAWYEVVASGDPRHLEAGTETRRIKSARQATYYVAKYCAKVSGLPFATPDGEWIEHHGRLWGVKNRAGVPFGRLRVVVTYGHENRESLLDALAGASGYDELRTRRSTESGTCYAEVSADWIAAICSGRRLLDDADKREALRVFAEYWLGLGAEWVEDDAYPIPPPPDPEPEPLRIVQERFPW